MTTTDTLRRFNAWPRLLAAGTALLAALVLAPQAHAQSDTTNRPRRDRREGQMDPQQRVERRVAMLTERLKLSSGQATQIRQILTQEREQMQALRPQRGAQVPRGDDAGRPDSAARDSVRTAMRAVHDRAEQHIDAVLNAEQRTAYRELRESRRDGRRGGWHRGGRDDRGAETGSNRQGTR